MLAEASNISCCSKFKILLGSKTPVPVLSSKPLYKF